jgi:Protein of unknown function (DUF1552)
MTLFAVNRPLSRRSFLRGAGVALSLPLLDAMVPAFARPAAAAAATGSPRRMVAIQTNLGILPHYFWPEVVRADRSVGKVDEKGTVPDYPLGAIRDYKASPYLEILQEFRREMTVFGGVSHPNVDGGHPGEKSFLTAAPHPGSGAFRNSVSLDQVAAERIGTLTRIPVLVTHVGIAMRSLSYTRGGVEIPPERSVAALYRRMFVQGTARETSARLNDLKKGKSVLDFVNDSAKRLQKDLGPRDRDRLDQYFTSVRDLEGRLHNSEEWEKRPKPVVKVPEPKDAAVTELSVASKLMYDLIRLALETDSTRLVTVFIEGLGIHSDIPGVEHETHTLTHHGNRPETLAELRTIESAQFRALAGLLAGLKGSREGGATLLDQTMVLYGTCMGSANAHSNVNLPMLLAGGGFRHAGLLAFDTRKNYPLPNLYVSMLQRLGLEVDKFASSTGTMRGLELA